MHLEEGFVAQNKMCLHAVAVEVAAAVEVVFMTYWGFSY